MRKRPARGSLTRFARALVDSNEATAAVVAVGDRRRLRRVATAAATRDTRFDLASLTKPFVATLALLLDRDRVLGLERRVGDFWPRSEPNLARRRLVDLLRHRSGLPPWAPLQALVAAPEDVPELLTRGLPVREPAPVEYGDLGYILWGFTAERALGCSLWDLLADRVCRPLGLCGVEPWPGARPDVAWSRADTTKETTLAVRGGFGAIPLRGPPPRGVPQDGNARCLGRLSGHAGLFGGVDDLYKFGLEWLVPGRVLERRDVERALSGTAPYALGWARRRVRGSAGPALGPRSFGHTGFTGTSLWIDPDRQALFLLLAHRTDAESDFNRWRRSFHAIATGAPSRP
jgi:CubicO group peptidase (beta-lactamase class C family)